MSKLLKVKISSCTHCPYKCGNAELHIGTSGTYCVLAKKKIVDYDTVEVIKNIEIPEWCPLENWEDENE